MTSINPGSTYIYAVVTDHRVLGYYESMLKELGYGSYFTSPDGPPSAEMFESVVEDAVNGLFEAEKHFKVAVTEPRLLVDFSGEHEKVLAKIRQMKTLKQIIVLDGTVSGALDFLPAVLAMIMMDKSRVVSLGQSIISPVEIVQTAA